MITKVFLLILILAFHRTAWAEPVFDAEPLLAAENAPPVLTMDEFIRAATARDGEFEEILIDELSLKYQKALRLPAKDLVLSVKKQHEFFIDQDRDDPDTTVGLSKLFPMTATSLALSYNAGTSLSSAEESSTLEFTIAQPIAENAFGRSTRLLDKIVGLEVNVASHQIIEAYEDYLANALTAYYTWYEDYQNLLIGQASYKENLRLLDNMYEREKQKIALPIDVNKVKLQVMARHERLIELEEQYKISKNIIERMIRSDGTTDYIPQDADPLSTLDGAFRALYERFTKESRTFDILRMLEKQSGLQVKRDADDLLPSISMIAGYESSGDNFNFQDEDNIWYAGLSMEWPIPDQVERAEFQVSRILDKKQQLISTNAYFRLYTQLANLYLQIERERKLIEIAEERILLAQAVLEDERKNYSFGRVSLNDYIQAFNNLDTNRFNKIQRDALHKKLIVEWLRLSDRLIQKADLETEIKEMETNHP